MRSFFLALFPVRTGVNRLATANTTPRFCLPRKHGGEPVRPMPCDRPTEVFPVRTGVNRLCGIEGASKRCVFPVRTGVNR